jgi:hypothetical protein
MTKALAGPTHCDLPGKTGYRAREIRYWLRSRL